MIDRMAQTVEVRDPRRPAAALTWLLYQAMDDELLQHPDPIVRQRQVTVVAQVADRLGKQQSRVNSVEQQTREFNESMKEVFAAFGKRLNAIARYHLGPEFEPFVDDFKREFRATMEELGHHR